jgi:hypothetical protein
MGPQVLEHAKNVRWDAALAEEMASFLNRVDIIVRDPSIDLPPKGSDEVKKRIEAGLLKGKEGFGN